MEKATDARKWQNSSQNTSESLALSSQRTSCCVMSVSMLVHELWRAQNWPYHGNFSLTDCFTSKIEFFVWIWIVIIWLLNSGSSQVASANSAVLCASFKGLVVFYGGASNSKTTWKNPAGLVWKVVCFHFRIDIRSLRRPTSSIFWVAWHCVWPSAPLISGKVFAATAVCEPQHQETGFNIRN